MPVLTLLQALLIGYVPGALIFRMPVAQRDRRAALACEERMFWAAILSLAWSLTVVLFLAAIERYRFQSLLFANGALSVLIALVYRRRLAFDGRASRPGWILALPFVLALLGLWRFFPPSEYVIGGKDPGTYMNEGVQMAQRGTLTIHEPVVAAVPVYARDLFFPQHQMEDYYGTRFMGFYLRDPRTGDSNGQFPQLFPASVAIGYGLYGLTGARLATGVWAILGVLAVYFAGARLVGAAAAFGAAALLSLNVIEVWFARYPNSEMAMQALLFAGLLAFARAHQDDDRFFAPIAGALSGMLLFTRVEAIPAIACLMAAGVLAWIVERRAIRGGFIAALAVWIPAAWMYYTGPIAPYTKRLFLWMNELSPLVVGAAVVGSIVGFIVLLWMRARFADRARTVVPYAFVAVVVLAAIYGAFFREPGGRLAEPDAHALRTFANLYLAWVGLGAAIVGFAVIVRRAFWRDPAFVVVFTGLCLFLFYKMRIPPIEFWAARRFVPIILPGALLFAAGAGLRAGARPGWLWRTAGVVVVAVLGYQYMTRAAPVMPHVEYAGMIPALEQLSARFTGRDLVLFESRDAGSDTHVLALPLAYIYARNVLVLNSARPDKFQLRAFLDYARHNYARTYFVGGGGTDLLSRHIRARAIDDAKIKVPEFESTTGTLPAVVHRKDFDYSVYELALDDSMAGPFTLDIGSRDDLNVVRFHAKETTDDRTIRWTGPQSAIAIPGLTGAEREVVLVMHDGGRPKQAAPAHVEVSLNGAKLGSTDVGPGFREYRFAIPPEVAGRAASADEPAQLTLVSSTWVPQQFLGGTDDRKLGVMLDAVSIR